jgi:hypothetical protein
MGWQGEGELTTSSKFSASNTTPSAARPLLFLVTYETNILLIHSLYQNRNKFDGATITYTPKDGQHILGPQLQKLGRNAWKPVKALGTQVLLAPLVFMEFLEGDWPLLKKIIYLNLYENFPFFMYADVWNYLLATLVVLFNLSVCIQQIHLVNEFNKTNGYRIC